MKTIASKYTGNAVLTLSKQVGGGTIAVRVIQSMLRAYKVEILEAGAQFRKGQIISVPRTSVTFASVKTTEESTIT